MLGASDAGKTTLVTRVAGALAARGEAVAVVDADLGQSEIGPPTTVGLGRVRGPVARLADAELVALEFVGVTSPARALRPAARAAQRLVDRARAAGFDRVLVDTSGLVAGDIGRALKRMKIDLVAPELILAVQRAGECEHILAAYAGGRPRVLRVAAEGTGRRTPLARREHRARALAAYFAGARQVTLAAGGVTLRGIAGPLELAALEPDLLVGLHDAGGETLGVGRVVLTDPAAGTLTVHTPVDPRLVAAVTAGREKLERG